MSIFPWIEFHVSKLYRLPFVRHVKNALRPIKHAIFGPQRIYLAIAKIKAAGDDVQTVVDVGAATGDTAVAFLHAFPRATVHCIEPLSDSFRKLTAWTKPYGDRVRLYQLALSRVAGERDLYVTSSLDSSSLLPSPALRTERVRCVTLDEFVRDAGIDRIDLLKIDVEGAERDILEGGRQAVAITKNIFVEISFNRRGKGNDDHVHVFRMLQEAGFYLMENYEHENFSFRKGG